MRRPITAMTAATLLAYCGTSAFAENAVKQTYLFAQNAGPSSEVIPVTPTTTYDVARGYGLEPGTKLTIESSPREADAGRTDATTNAGSFLFSVKLPEGNYRVTVKLGSVAADSDTAIKAEARRIMWPLTKLPRSQSAEAQFTVNVRTAKINATTSVKLNDREKDSRQWDEKLTLEFAGKHPAVISITVEKVTDAVTVFLAGDSTVTDQGGEPWAAWGQLIPQFFKPSVAVANYAESGRTLKSFAGDRRWEKLLSELKAGDYVFIQFGHNDMKEKGNGVGPYTSFSDSLRKYIADARAKGAFPVVCTPMHRRKFADGQIQPTFGDYPDAIRKVANETATPLIDLQLMSKPLYEYYGPEKSKRLFVHFPAGTFPDQAKALADDTHFQAFGAEQIARCVVQGIRDLKLPLAKDLRDGIPAYDPSHPGDPDTYDLPPSAAGKPVTPAGN